MKLNKIFIVLISIFLMGCGNAKSTNYSSSSKDMYISQKINDEKNDSYEVMVQAKYSFQHEGQELASYQIDGSLHAAHILTEPVGILSQNIDSDGSKSSMNGYYYEGSLYNTFNNIQYKENMSFENVENILLIPMDPFILQEDGIESVSFEQENESHRYTLILKDAYAKEVFKSHYDCNHLSDNYDVSITNNQVIQKFDEDDNFVYEKVHFEMEVIYNEQPIQIIYDSFFQKNKVNKAEVVLEEDVIKSFESYVNYSEIDTDQMTSDEGNEGESVIDILKSRLKSRLNYEELPSGLFQTSFNENERYTIDFDNQTFEYARYSITYSYSWKGDIGSMGACTYHYSTGQKSSSCEDSTIETLEEVKKYFEMELYFCDLAITDLKKGG